MDQLFESGQASALAEMVFNPAAVAAGVRALVSSGVLIPEYEQSEAALRLTVEEILQAACEAPPFLKAT